MRINGEVEFTSGRAKPKAARVGMRQKEASEGPSVSAAALDHNDVVAELRLDGRVGVDGPVDGRGRERECRLLKRTHHLSARLPAQVALRAHHTAQRERERESAAQCKLCNVIKGNKIFYCLFNRCAQTTIFLQLTRNKREGKLKG